MRNSLAPTFYDYYLISLENVPLSHTQNQLEAFFTVFRNTSSPSQSPISQYFKRTKKRGRGAWNKCIFRTII